MLRNSRVGSTRRAAPPPVPRRADGPSALWSIVRLHGLLKGTISPTAANAIAGAIQTQEGWYPGSVSYQNNNPGNLVYAGQPGATLGVGGFAAFSSYADGQAALVNQIQLDATRGTDVNGNPTTTLSQLIGSWAPASDGNDTAAYIANVSAATGYDPSASLSSLGDPSMLTAPVDPIYGSGTGTLSAGIDLGNVTSSTVDLSSIGLPSDTPVLYAAIGGLCVLSLLSRQL